MLGCWARWCWETGLVVGTLVISLLDSAGGVCYDWFPFLPFWFGLLFQFPVLFLWFELLFRSPVLPLREGLACWVLCLGVGLCLEGFFLVFFSGCLGWCRWGEGFVHLVVLGLACGFSVVWCLYLWVMWGLGISSCGCSVCVPWLSGVFPRY